MDTNSKHLQVTRRTAILGASIAAASVTVAGSAQAANSSATPIRYAYVGCRTTRARNARGDGLAVFRIDPSSRAWTLQQTHACENPSFLAFNKAGDRLYTVHGDMTELSAFKVDRKTGGISLINTAPCNGRNPVHLAFDPSGRFLVVANHITKEEAVSNVSTVAVEQDGSLGKVVSTIELPGKIGPHRVEQPFSKPHQCLFDPSGKLIVVPDKGLDRVFALTLTVDGQLQRVEPNSAIAREGSGPRHIVYHPTLPFLFVINELTSTVMSCRYDPATGEITPIQELSSLPDTFIAFNRAAEIDISPEGSYIYVSNRGHESIATFSFERATGRLSSVGWTKCLGETPRFFNLSPDARELYVANETSDTIVRFVRHADNGVVARGEVVAKTGSPTCILFA
ncbi:lactonase family protein [Sphingobium rhizovicinum]|uniref:Lactonase family protein n=1 Tax=Sphingobium rhizovicinum TaxID=432308 RepID=A0ABV7NKB7_9SPHN